MENKVNLAAIDSDYYNPTFKYRINGFAEACGIHDIDFVPDSCKAYKEDEDKNVIYDITSENDFKDGIKSYELTGIYHNLFFSFINLIRPGESISNKKEQNFKFIMILCKTYDETTYKLYICPEYFHYFIKIEKENKTKATKDEVKLKLHIRNMDKVFKIAKLFNANPEQFYEIFSKELSQKGLRHGNVIYNKIVNNYNVKEEEKVYSKTMDDNKI